MSDEPKRYMIHANRLCVVDDGGKFALGYVPVICADDPVLQSWKRDSEALEKLEEMAKSTFCVKIAVAEEGALITLIGDEDAERKDMFLFPTLLEAIESASCGESASSPAFGPPRAGGGQEGEGK